MEGRGPEDVEPYGCAGGNFVFALLAGFRLAGVIGPDLAKSARLVKVDAIRRKNKGGDQLGLNVAVTQGLELGGKGGGEATALLMEHGVQAGFDLEHVTVFVGEVESTV